MMGLLNPHSVYCPEVTTAEREQARHEITHVGGGLPKDKVKSGNWIVQR